MKKLHPDGTIKEYPESISDDWLIHDMEWEEHEQPIIQCDCGSESFRVAWWDYPYTGGYCKITCTECGKSRELIDDYG